MAANKTHMQIREKEKYWIMDNAIFGSASLKKNNFMNKILMKQNIIYFFLFQTIETKMIKVNKSKK